MYAVSFVVLGLLASFVSACNSTSFKSSEKSNKQPATIQQQQDFPLRQSLTGKIDMVWVIDNSGSMEEEIGNVEKNISSFASKLQGVVNLNLAMISATRTNLPSSAAFGIDLNRIVPTALQIPVPVSSRNGLALLANASCPVSNTASGMVCDQAVNPGLEMTSSVQQAAGKLAQFYSQDSRKVFVIVTDDDALGVDHTNFWSLIGKNPYITQENSSVYGFIGIAKASSPTCSIAREGVAYKQLAKNSSTDDFDVCGDWDPQFKTLLDNIVKSTNSAYTLTETRPLTVQDVLVDGTVLPKDQYQVQGRLITLLHPQALPGTAQNLTVRYSVN